MKRMQPMQTTLDIFLKKKRTENQAQVVNTTSEDSENVEIDNHSEQHSDQHSEQNSEQKVLETVQESSQKSFEIYDIGNYIENITSINDKVKYELIKNPWKPPKDFKLPFSTHNKKGKEEKRYLNHNHLDSFPWLVYSDTKKGVFCKYCAIFVTGFTGGFNKHVPLQKLVTKPLTMFSKLLGKDGDLNHHEKNQYHINAFKSAQHFMQSYESPSENILNKIDKAREEKVKENIKRLIPIVESIIYLGRQNISLRGHRDDGDLQSEIENPLVNEGNFRELLRYRVNSGDSILENHLKTCNARATYISKTTQNELIACCGEEILDNIIERVKKAKYYCVIFDETTDVSHTSQLSICLSYVYEGKRREDFISFIDVHHTYFQEKSESFEPKVTGVILGKIVIEIIKNLHIDLNNCVGIGTDGCSMMVSEHVGAVAEIRKEAKFASRCICFNHALNLSISKMSSVQSIRNSVGVIQSVVSFFSASAKRNYVLLNVVKADLKSICETRWVERGESLMQFTNSIDKIVLALKYISNWTDTVSSTKAKMLLFAVRDGDFLLAIHCQLTLYFLFLPLSRLFQKKTLDLSNATSLIKNTISIVKEKRCDPEKEFKEIFSKTTVVAEKLEVTIKVPRMANLQTNRVNVPHSSPEEYYRRSIYIPMLDSVIMDLEMRFSKDSLSSCDLSCLLPKNLLKLNEKDLLSKVKNLCNSYGALVTTEEHNIEDFLLSEIRLWKAKWHSMDESTITDNVENTLNHCDEDIFKLVRELLKLLLTLPISVASAERSFSSLRRLKTYLRNRMSEERLTGLALLNIHRDIPVDPETVIQRFAKTKKRNMDFIL